MQETLPWVREIPWSGQQLLTPVFLPGKFHGERRLVGYRPWGCEEWNTTEWTPHTHIFTHMYTCIYTSHIWMILLRFTDNCEFTPIPPLPLNATEFTQVWIVLIRTSRLWQWAAWADPRQRAPHSSWTLASPFGALSPKPGPFREPSFPRGLQHPLSGSPRERPPSSIPEALSLLWAASHASPSILCSEPDLASKAVPPHPDQPRDPGEGCLPCARCSWVVLEKKRRGEGREDHLCYPHRQDPPGKSLHVSLWRWAFCLALWVCYISPRAPRWDPFVSIFLNLFLLFIYFWFFLFIYLFFCWKINGFTELCCFLSNFSMSQP